MNPWILPILTAIIFCVPNGHAAPLPSDAVLKGKSFLANLFEPDLGLLPEYRGANVYWLFHDNYLAAKVLKESNPGIAGNIMAAIQHEGTYSTGRMGLLFGETNAWDGKGFLDAAAKHDGRYATYKLGLALLASAHLSPPAQPPQGLQEKLLTLQNDSGGWITDYDAAGNKIGLANVETTSLAILGLEAVNAHK